MTRKLPNIVDNNQTSEKKGLTHCKSCSHKKETNHWSSDGWDRMCDWVCSAADNKQIAESVEWKDEKHIKVPAWCPIIPATETAREVAYIVKIVYKIKPQYRVCSSKAMGVEILVDFIRRVVIPETMNNSMNILMKELDGLSTFNEVSKFVESSLKGAAIRPYFFAFTTHECYVDEGFDC